MPDTSSDDDDLVTTHLLCCEDEVMTVDTSDVPCAWRCELEVPRWISDETASNWSPNELLLATTEKKQRTEV